MSVGDTVEAVLPWLFGAELTLSLIDLVVVILLLIGVVHKRHKYYIDCFQLGTSKVFTCIIFVAD